MNIVDRGTGPPLVLIPGIQGRWEYMRPGGRRAGRALSRHHVLALRRARTGRAVRRGRAGSTTTSIRSTARSIDCGIDAAIVCGISFGGLVALRFAARASGPDRRAGPGLDAGAGLASSPASRDLRAAAVALRPAVSRRIAAGACGASCAAALPDARRAGASRARSCGRSARRRSRSRGWRRVRA